jgi:magnesium transporter
MTLSPEVAAVTDKVIRLLRRNNTRNLSPILATLRPVDIAYVYRRVEPGRWKQLFNLVDDIECRAEILTELDEEILEQFVERFSDDDLSALLRSMSSDDAADILEILPEERAAAILARTGYDDLSEAVELLSFDPESAGGLMSPDVFSLPASMTAGDAITELQQTSDELEMVFYLYVVNDHGHLVGVCSLRELVIVPPEIQLADIMSTDVVRVDQHTDQEEVAKVVERYNLLAVPVVDASNKLVGLVTVDDIIDVIRAEATEDMLKMAGVGDVDISERENVLSSARARIPWLFASFIGGVAAVLVIGLYESALHQVTALAAFIPIILGMGGNVGTQSATIVTRGIALGQIDLSRLRSVVARELLIGVLAGLLYGFILGLLVGFLYASDPNVGSIAMLSLTVGLAILTAMTIAALVGGAVPLLFQRINVDPAIAAGPFVTTSVDVLGILAYFSIAKLLLGL